MTKSRPPVQNRLLLVVLVAAAGAVALAGLTLHERIVERDVVEVRTLTLSDLEDGSYDHEIAFSITRRRVFRTWLGVERVAEDVGHGIEPSSRYELRSDDDATLRVGGGRLRPVTVGDVTLFAIHRDGRIDTFAVRVHEERDHLMIASEPLYRSR